MDKPDTTEVILARAVLEKHYGEPVYPVNQVCMAVHDWMERIKAIHKDGAQEWRQGYRYFQLLDNIWIDIRKSNLLYRVLYHKQEPLPRECPTKRCQGRWGNLDCPECGGTGWLPAEPIPAPSKETHG